MKKKTKKTLPKVKRITPKEAKILKDVLALFEVHTYKNTGVKHISGGFARAERVDYDDEIINIELKWGVQSDCTDNVHTEQWQLKRSDLTEDKSTAEIANLIFE